MICKENLIRDKLSLRGSYPLVPIAHRNSEV